MTTTSDSTPKPKRVLTPEELVALLEVDTTYDEAVTIKKRWEGLLAFAEKVKPLPGDCVNYDDLCSESRLGCPHCNYNYVCDRCSYFSTSTRKRLVREGICRFYCLHFTFGGISMAKSFKREVLILSAERETITLALLRQNILDGKLIPETWKEEIDKIITLCKGHIEWANAVLGEDLDVELAETIQRIKAEKEKKA